VLKWEISVKTAYKNDDDDDDDDDNNNNNSNNNNNNSSNFRYPISVKVTLLYLYPF